MSHLSFPRMLKVDFVQSFLLVVISWSLLLCVSQQAAAQMKFVQVNSAVPTSTATISATYNSAQTAGNMNVVAIGWDNALITHKRLTDNKGNSYKQRRKGRPTTQIRTYETATTVKSASDRAEVPGCVLAARTCCTPT